MTSAPAQRLLWIVPEARGGICDYGRALGPVVRGELLRRSVTDGGSWEWTEATGELPAISEVVRLHPSVIHIQHEYGLFGGKYFPFYGFPAWVARVRAALPSVRIIATAHTVLARDYRVPVAGRGMQIPIRLLVNALFLRFFKQVWGARTWAPLDAVIVHSENQCAPIREAGAKRVECIPHFVFPIRKIAEPAASAKKTVVVFGYFTPEKGQDVAIRALALLPDSVRLVLAGGVRRSQDQGYFERCQALVRELGLESRVEITGFVPAGEVDATYGRAALVLAPFRETSGSGSLAQAFARGRPILASDLPLNQELSERVPGCLALFRSENPESCAAEISRLLLDLGARTSLERGALAYAERFSLTEIAKQHADLYSSLWGIPHG